MAESRLSLRVACCSKFSGRSGEDLDKWLSHFELRFRGLKDDERAEALIDVLEGEAFDVCVQLGAEKCTSYKAVKEALQRRFGGSTDPLQAYAELANVSQATTESIEAYAERVLRMTAKAFPGMDTKQLQVNALKPFLCGLVDHELQTRLISRDDVISLDTAVLAAAAFRTKAEVLSAMRAKKDGGTAAVVKNVNQPSHSISFGAMPEAPSLLEMKHQLESIHRTLSQQGSGSGREYTPRGSVNKRGSGCFHCGDPAHFKRSCPQLQGHQAESGDAALRRAPPQGVPRPFCYGCGRWNHWMSQCFRIPAAAASANKVPGTASSAGTYCWGCQ